MVILYVYSQMYIHTYTRVVKTRLLQLFFSLSDACDPTWRSTRDGLTYSALAVSLFAFIYTANWICVHIYWQKCEELHFYVMTMFLVTICSETTLSQSGGVLALFSGPAFVAVQYSMQQKMGGVWEKS